MQTDPVDDITLIDGTGSLVTYLAISGTLDAFYLKGDGSQLTNISPSVLPSGVVSSSAQTIANLFGTNIVSGSGQRSVLGLGTTDSPTFSGLTVNGTLTTREFHTQFVSASIIFDSGSTKFGNSLDDTHQFTGSLFVSGTISGSFTGDGSGLTGIINTLPSGLISSSTQITDFGFISSSDWVDITNKPSGLVSSSVQTLANLSGSNIVSGSGQRSVLGLGESDSPRFSTVYATNASIDNNLIVGGTITARTYVISSSVVNIQTMDVSGSTIFGDTLNDTHQFTGSVSVTGSVSANYFSGDGRYLTNVTASFPTENVGEVALPASQTKFFINDDISGSASGNKNISWQSMLQDIAGTGLVVTDFYDSIRVDPNLSGLDSVSATSFTGSLEGTSSYALTASYALNAGGATIDSGSFATTASNTFFGSQTVNGNITVTGNLTAQQYIVSSSVLYLTESFSSGSTMFGNSLDDTHKFTGSLYVTGALVIPTVQTLPVTADVGSVVINSNNLYIYF
jgi:hypothetical protein